MNVFDGIAKAKETKMAKALETWRYYLAEVANDSPMGPTDNELLVDAMDDLGLTLENFMADADIYRQVESSREFEACYEENQKALNARIEAATKRAGELRQAVRDQEIVAQGAHGQIRADVGRHQEVRRLKANNPRIFGKDTTAAAAKPNKVLGPNNDPHMPHNAAAMFI